MLVNRYPILIPLILFALPVIASGCTFFEEEAEAGLSDAGVQAVTVELHLSRTSLTQTEYEQYRFMGDRVYKECGSIKAGRPVVKEQDLLSVDSENRSTVAKVASRLFTRLTQNPAVSWEPPGRNVDLFDPGKALLTLRVGERKVDIRTSISALDAPSEKAAVEAAELVKTLRQSAGGAPCGNRKFYGIG